MQQKVITAEETTRYLEEVKQAEIEAQIAQEKATELARQAKELQEQEAADAVKRAEEARVAQIEAEKKAAILKKAQEEEAARKAAAAKKAEQEAIARLAAEEKRIAQSCTSTQCYHEGKCRNKPNHALCAPNDDDNAWICTDGYVDTGRACISKTEYDSLTAQATAPKKKAGVLKQRYFNPYNE